MGERPNVGRVTEELRREEEGLLACVHCGFCLNACPTYTRLGHEGDSPRGRLDLMRAVVEGRLDADDEAFRTHIDRCLGCRACEPVCPSGVPYGFLLERARSAIERSAGTTLTTRLLIAGFTGGLRPLATFGSRLLRDTGFARVFARIAPSGWATLRFGMAMLASSRADGSLLRRASPGPAARAAPSGRAVPSASGVRRAAGDGLPAGAPGPADDVAPDAERAVADPHGLMGAFPRATAATPAPVPGEPAPPRRVSLLEGCVQRSLFARVNHDTEHVLAANGCSVLRAPGQACCGALDAHAGRLDRARELARRNIAAFEAAGADVVVVNAAGCGAMMKEYAEQLKADPAWAERAERFAARVRDLSEYLAALPVRPGAPVELRVTFDAPCHLHHAQRIRQAPLDVLDAVPGLERIPLRDADECCGGAGLYGVHHPELGGRILADKVAAIRDTGARAVLTPNPGCMMQIGAGLLLAGVDVAVLHPIEILAESYRREESTER